jgi:tRNA(Arg) A34 adenosine deaminase TadA
MKDAAIRAAIEASKQSQHKNMLHGACLFKGGSVIQAKANIPTYSRFASRFHAVPSHASIHAEIACILGVDRKVTNNADVYVCRVTPTGKLSESKPCPMCEAAMRFVGIKRVYHTNSKGEWETLYL